VAERLNRSEKQEEVGRRAKMQCEEIEKQGKTKAWCREKNGESIELHHDVNDRAPPDYLSHVSGFSLTM